MIDPSNIVKSLQIEGLTPDEQMQVLQGIQRTIAQSKKIQRQENIKSNVSVVIDLLKKIEADIRSRYDEVGNRLEARAASLKDGIDGQDGKPGQDGRDGRDGPMGPRGQDGRNGQDGKDGQDGVSVTDAKIDFDGSLIITLSTGREINVGEVVAADLAEKIRVTMSTNSTVGIQDEGTTITSGVRNINFTGTGVTATASGDSVTVNVSGGGGGGSGTVTSVDVSGGTTGLTTSGGPVTTSGTITLAGTLAIANGGTGATTAATARTNLGSTTVGGNLFTLTNPSAVTFPRFNADNTISALSASAFRTAIGAGTGDGTVTSVTGTAPVSSSGGATPAISLAASYGDTQNPYASKTAAFFLAAPAVSTGAPTFRAVVATDIPTLNQNTTGTASNVTGTVALANGGSGQTTAQTAMNAFAGAVTSGSYLRGNGTNVVMATIQAADVPTLNQNTTGTASNVTGTVAIANGGTGQTTQTAAFDALSPSTTKGDLIGNNGTNDVRIPVGTNGYVLTADSSAASGVAWSAAGGGSALTIQDEGTTLTAAASSINFAGTGVTATAVGNAVTVTISGGGGSGTKMPKALLDTWMIGAM